MNGIRRVWVKVGIYKLQEVVPGCGTIGKPQERLGASSCHSENSARGKRGGDRHQENEPAELCKLGVHTEAMLFQ